MVSMTEISPEIQFFGIISAKRIGAGDGSLAHVIDPEHTLFLQNIWN
jgi:hypothetical protein